MNEIIEFHEVTQIMIFAKSVTKYNILEYYMYDYRKLYTILNMISLTFVPISYLINLLNVELRQGIIFAYFLAAPSHYDKHIETNYIIGNVFFIYKKNRTNTDKATFTSCRKCWPWAELSIVGCRGHMVLWSLLLCLATYPPGASVI